MRAVGYKQSLPIDQAEALIDLEIEKPGAAQAATCWCR